MKSKLIIKVSALLIIAIPFFYCNTPVKAPKRVDNIPTQAVWHGGIDGGRWYVIDKVLSENSFKIRVYNDFSGQLIIESKFILNKDCLMSRIDSLTLLSKISAYDGDKIILNISDNGKYCYLTTQ